MEGPRCASGWGVRTSTPGAEIPVAALVFYPTEFRRIEAKPASATPGKNPGLRIARRGMLVIAAPSLASWQSLLANVDRGAQVVLREPSGRNHEVKLAWRYTPPEQHERYQPDGLAGLYVRQPGDVVTPWQAGDLDTLDDLSWVLSEQ